VSVSCEQVVRALWDYLDGALDAPTMAAIDAHLAQCDGCREHARFERALVRRIRELRNEHVDAELLRLRILETLTDSGWR
jgi:anti-sigma factor (TIGR02949 family)